jgi:hypothetical protein
MFTFIILSIMLLTYFKVHTAPLFTDCVVVVVDNQLIAENDLFSSEVIIGVAFTIPPNIFSTVLSCDEI